MNSNIKPIGFVRWSDSISATLYNGCIIILDELKNDFVFFDDQQSTFILEVISKHSSELSEEQISELGELVLNGLISFDTTPPILNECFQGKLESTGAFECDWALGDGRAPLSSFRLMYFTKALYFLLFAKKNQGKGVFHAYLII